MPKISSRTNAVPLSGIREMMDLAATIPGVLHLEIGDPDFQTPRAITEAAFDWALKNRVGYPPNSGLMDLRKTIAEKVTRVNRLPCMVENINVTVGATGALYLALLAAIEPGAEVLVPDPGWAGYPAMVGLAGGTMKPYALSADDGFRLDIAAVEKAITPKTGAIILNSPSNPTGVLFAKEALETLLALAAKHDIWIIADECYDEVVFQGRHEAIGALESLEDSRVLSAFSFSKTYAMTGWRVGYLVAPAAVSRHVTRMQAASVASASVVAQVAALAGLRGSQAPVTEMVGAYKRRRDLVMRMLDAAGIGYVRPDGALYVMVDIRPTGVPSKELALAFLKESAVCTTAGSAFGAACEGFLEDLARQRRRRSRGRHRPAHQVPQCEGGGLDPLGEAGLVAGERVLEMGTQELGGESGVACLDRAEDAAMLRTDDREMGVRRPDRREQAPVAVGVQHQELDDVDEPARARRPVEGEVEGAVRRGGGLEVARFKCGDHLGVKCLGFLDFTGRDVGASLLEGDAFQDDPERVGVGHVGRRHRSHPRALVRDDLDEPCRLKKAQRLAHGNEGNFVFRCDHIETQRLSGLIAPVKDRPPHALVYTFDLRDNASFAAVNAQALPPFSTMISQHPDRRDRGCPAPAATPSPPPGGPRNRSGQRAG